jgi:hypothetical protein
VAGTINNTLTEIRRDPIGAAIVVLTVAAFAIGAGLIIEPMLPAEVRITASKPEKPALEAAPAAWLDKAKPGDVLEVPGHTVHYWGKPVDTGPDAEPIVGIVAHHDINRPILNFVRYLHNGDRRRGGHFGYSIAVDHDGHIAQAAPLRYRTHHIKPAGAGPRTSMFPQWDSSSTIGIILVGACQAKVGTLWRCETEVTTPAQIEAAVSVVAALRKRFGLPCEAIAGHGQLQTDRTSWEGAALVKAVAESCKSPLIGADQVMALGAR